MRFAALHYLATQGICGRECKRGDDESKENERLTRCMMGVVENVDLGERKIDYGNPPPFSYLSESLLYYSHY